MTMLSDNGKKVARRSFAAMTAVLLCATALGTNFLGIGVSQSSSIVGGFEAFAANGVTYEANKTYYDAGELVMNAYYDSSTGQRLAESEANYKKTDWDVTSATSYLGSDAVSIITTTDVANSGKVGSASSTAAGGDGKNGIMCYSEYLDTDKQRTVPDYEAPAANADVTYQYIAEGKTTLTADNQVQIDWEVRAWPTTQAKDGSTLATRKSKLDTTAEIQTEWAKGVDDTTSMFYNGQPIWFSGNQGAFDDWCKDGNEKYLMNNGLWSRIETSEIQISKDANGKLTYTGTPACQIALFNPANHSESYTSSDYAWHLTEATDTKTNPLYTYMNDSIAPADDLSGMTLAGILQGQTNLRAMIPTYNIRHQIKNLWDTTVAGFLKGKTNVNVRIVNGSAATPDKIFQNKTVTGVRLYAIMSTVRADGDYIKSDSGKAYIKQSVETQNLADTITTGSTRWVSAYQDGIAYGSSAALAEGVKFVFNERDINSAEKIYHIDSLPGNILNTTDIYSVYGDNGEADTASGKADDVANIIVPYLVRSDAYYDITDGYQRAAGELFGRIDSATITTSAVNDASHGKTAVPSAQDAIVDTVTYSGLTGGEEYVLKGAIYKSTDTSMGTAIATATKTFTALGPKGETEVAFTGFDSSSLSNGDKLVVTEVLYAADGTTEIAKHQDLTDAEQTITYKNQYVNTKASLNETMTTITDEVSYAGFTGTLANVSGTITTTVWDATTGDMLPESMETPFKTAASGQGTATIKFDKFDSAALSGHTLVVFEEVKVGDTIVKHNDKTDKLQTVKLGADADIKTVAKSGTGSKYLDAIDGETIVDSVEVSGLVANSKYTAVATLYDATTGKLVTDKNNQTLTWQQAFTSDASGKGTVEVTITDFAASDKAGHTLVVYEDIINASQTSVCTHNDATDADQTVEVKKAGITTVLTDNAGKKETESSASMVFKDAISYSGLVPSNKYYMVSTLVDKATGKVLKDSNGNEAVVTSTVFNANTTGTNKGGSSFTFANMATEMSGKTVVAYNDLYRVTDGTAADSKVTSAVKAELVASEHDLANADQTVAIDATIVIKEPKIDTVAKSVDGEKTIPLATNSTIKDKVKYEGLTPNKTYTLTADVYDTNTGSRAAGYTKVKTMDFTSSETGKGEVIMTIDVNTTELSGHKLVVYEVLSQGDTTVASHRDLTDKDQTVTVNDKYQASIDTVATSQTGGKTIPMSEGASIIDTVTYDGLDTTQSYTLTTSVYDKSTGAKAAGVKDVTTTFTPEAVNGTVEVTIPVNGTQFTSGQSLVVYEELKTTSKTNSSSNSDSSTTSKIVTVATHKDISDADQTVTFVKMSTFLTGDGTSSKTVHVGSDAYVIDTASFTGLTPGRTYTITTQLIDIAANSTAVTLDTNTAVSNQASGSAVATRTMEFTPTTANGSIAMQINVNTASLAGHQLVAIATVTDKSTGNVVANHLDKSNVDQTVTVQTRVEAQTGVGSMSWIFGFIAMLSLAAVGSYGIGLYSDKKRNRI